MASIFIRLKGDRRNFEKRKALLTMFFKFCQSDERAGDTNISQSHLSNMPIAIRRRWKVFNRHAC